MANNLNKLDGKIQMKAMFHPAEEYKLPQDDEAFSYDNDFDKFNDIQ